MKTYIRRLLQATCVCLLLALTAQAQHRELFGPANLNASGKTTPRHGIHYNPRDFDRPNPKQVKKSKNWLANHGAVQLVDEFDSFAVLAGVESQLAEWFDEAYEDKKDDYIKCGGRYAQAARTFNPRSIMITIEAAPFPVFYQGKWITAGGYWEPSSRSIRVSIAAVYGMKDWTPDRWQLSKVYEYARWEINRAIGSEIGLVDPNPESPCK